jgi:hypothetical protein
MKSFLTPGYAAMSVNGVVLSTRVSLEFVGCAETMAEFFTSLIMLRPLL